MENDYCLRGTHFTCAKIFLWGICRGEISMDTSKGTKELPMTAREVRSKNLKRRNQSRNSEMY